jgi:hypothetical protein
MLHFPAFRSADPLTLRDWIKKIDAHLLWAFNPQPHLRRDR